MTITKNYTTQINTFSHRKRLTTLKKNSLIFELSSINSFALQLHLYLYKKNSIWHRLKMNSDLWMDYLELYNFISCKVKREKFHADSQLLDKTWKKFPMALMQNRKWRHREWERQRYTSFAEKEIAWKIKHAFRLDVCNVFLKSNVDFQSFRIIL